LERDDQKNTDDAGHDWSLELNEHISQAMHDRTLAKEAESSALKKCM
jgi:hypothetical protein